MKKLCKKIIIGAFILLFVFLFKVQNVDAASCRIGVSAPKSIVVGKSFNVTVSVSGSAAIGSWEYTLSYDSSKVRLNSGSLHIVDYGNGSKKSASYSYSFTALKSGTATFKPVNASVLDYSSTNECLSSTGSASVTMKTQAEIEESYSKNNNLSSLSVEGAELSPAFNKNTLEYSALLPVDTTKAKINASVEDKTATVQGTGEIDVVDGLNKVEIVVTAQHGEKKTYVINLTVQELDPINVNVEGKNYTVVRKKGQVEEIPVGFAESSVKIKDQDIAAYKSEIAKLTLVGLKDKDGNISLFIYDEKNNKYTAFEQLKGNLVNLLVLDNDKKAPSEFEKTSFRYNNISIDGYKLKNDKKDNYYLVYAKNLETGSEDFYLYDKKDNTFQRFFEDITKQKDEQIKYLFYISAGLLGLFILIIIFKIFKALFTSKQRKIRKYEKKIKKLKAKLGIYDDDDDSYDISSVDERPEIKQVDDDEYIVPKKSRKQKMKEIEEAKRKLDSAKPSYRRLSLEDDD